MVKRTDTADSWVIHDNKRDLVNPRKKYLLANAANAEAADLDGIDFLSNGFQLKDDYAYYNASGGTYLYMAFAADPDTEAPTVAKSFSTVTYTGTGSSQSIDGLGFKPNFVWIKNRDTADRWHQLFDSIRVHNALASNTTGAEVAEATNGVRSFDADGFTVAGTGSYTNGNGLDYVAWAWKADDNEPTIFGGPAKAVYKFEDNANDVTGDYNATATNVTYSSSGKFNKAAEFNGSSSKLDTGYTFANTTFSVSLWFKTTDTSKILITNTSDTTPASSNDGFRIYTDRVVLTQDDVNVVTRNFSSSLGDGNWHNVAVTNDGSTLTVYIDGSAAHTNSSTSFTQNNSYPVVIGYQPRSTINQYLNGSIDQVRFYNGSIKAEQVTELYNETASQNDDLTLGGPPETIISANANAGFSIVKYEGDGQQNHKVPHGLSAAPEIVFIKNLDQADTWQLFGSTFFDRMQFNTGADDGNYLLSYSSTTITLPQSGQHANNEWNASGNNYIAYCFHSVSNYSKIGSYTGNGSSNSITGLGFQPDWILIKDATSTGSWFIYDSVRTVSVGDNAGTANARPYIIANASGKENGATSYNVNLDSDGFSMNTSSSELNSNGETYIYMAFKIN